MGLSSKYSKDSWGFAKEQSEGSGDGKLLRGDMKGGGGC